MSYAAVAAHNAPPPSAQPHPDLALLSTEPPSHDNIADDAAKLNIVSSDFKSNPATLTSVQNVSSGTSPVPVNDNGTPVYTNIYAGTGGISDVSGSGSGFPRGSASGGTGAGGGPSKKDKARKFAHDAEQEGFQLWYIAKQRLLQPGVAAGLFGVVNVGLLSWTTYALYTRPYLRSNPRFVGSTVAAALAVLGVEGFAAERWRESPRGQEEEARAKREGSILYRHAREVILRPGVLRGLLGLINSAVLGTIGYFAYKNWDAPRWDRRVVSAISVGLFTLCSGEGYIAEQYRQTHH